MPFQYIFSNSLSLLNSLKTGACPAETTGDNVTQGIFFWDTTAGNAKTAAVCPYGNINSNPEYPELYYELEDGSSMDTWPGAYRKCQCDNTDCQNPYWLNPDTLNCDYRVYNYSEVADALSILYQVCVNLDSLYFGHM